MERFFRNFGYNFGLRLEDFVMSFVIHGLALLLDFILNLVFGKQSSQICVMFSINFTYDSLGLPKPLTASQKVSRNRRLNIAFELSLIIRIFKYLLFFGDFLN